MRYIFPIASIALLVLLFSFHPKGPSKTVSEDKIAATGSIDAKPLTGDSHKTVEFSTQAVSFVEYAKTLIGTPYMYGSVDPDRGLDCSGFVNCVSNHFGIKLPRSSVDFTNLGTTIETGEAKPGDLILFTGTDLRKHIVGHVGIITDNINGEVEFIHSSSGKANGVIVSDLSDYYKSRLVKVIRIFPTAANKVIV